MDLRSADIGVLSISRSFVMFGGALFGVSHSDFNSVRASSSASSESAGIDSLACRVSGKSLLSGVAVREVGSAVFGSACTFLLFN